MNHFDFRRRAARVRDVPLETVLELCHAVRDPRDRHRWHTEQGPVSITGQKFMNWRRHQGGGGAIDLVMHLIDLDVRDAVAWLEQQTSAGHATVGITGHASSNSLVSSSAAQLSEPRKLRLPIRDDKQLRRVRNYLTRHRHLSSPVLAPLIEAGRLYADGRGNAVFLLVAGKANVPIGAELRGTGERTWRGMARGTQKNKGYFWVGTQGQRRVVICESAIDAISCHMLHADRICVSTAGVRANPPWLRVLLDRGFEVECGFDADPPGDTAAGEMLRLNPTIRRLRPAAKDWNLLLASNS